MTLSEKINEAIEYVRFYRTKANMGELIDMHEVKNDAANIFGDTMEEYNAIWEAVEEL